MNSCKEGDKEGKKEQGPGYDGFISDITLQDNVIFLYNTNTIVDKRTRVRKRVALDERMLRRVACIRFTKGFES